ncbi:hypothetical protein LCGC14_2074400 [marine sediment metagenome]|uniref:Uncharacterized protein n=1 Tax=marine sediment metagenome TaxID=412755 RepID=A0A0F9EHN3_9ZZZZ
MDKEMKLRLQYALEQLSGDDKIGLNKTVILNIPWELWWNYVLVCYMENSNPYNEIKDYLSFRTPAGRIDFIKQNFKELIK